MMMAGGLTCDVNIGRVGRPRFALLAVGHTIGELIGELTIARNNHIIGHMVAVRACDRMPRAADGQHEAAAAMRAFQLG